MSSGWPQIKVLALPLKEILPLIFMMLTSLLLPIIISCVIYLVLICKKKKLFENKIENSNDDKPLHIVHTSFLKCQCPKSLRENIFKEDVVNSNNVQADVKDLITQNIDIISHSSSNINNQDELPNSKSPNSNITSSPSLIERQRINNNCCPSNDNETSVSTTHNVKDIEDWSTTGKCQCPHNPSMTIELDADQEFKHIEMEKTRFHIIVKIIF